MVRVDAKVDGDANRLMQSSTGALLPPFAAAAAIGWQSRESTELSEQLGFQIVVVAKKAYRRFPDEQKKNTHAHTHTHTHTHTHIFYR